MASLGRKKIDIDVVRNHNTAMGTVEKYDFDNTACNYYLFY